MKHWMVSYTITYVDGKKEELEAIFRAEDIARATVLAYSNIVEPFRKNPEVTDVVIRSISVTEERPVP